jgi:hypothetical protein
LGGPPCSDCNSNNRQKRISQRNADRDTKILLAFGSVRPAGW